MLIQRLILWRMLNFYISKRFVLMLFILLSAVTTVSAQTVKPPNIVFILADDLNNELFSHMDRVKALIAANGTTFRNHFVSVSLCCPSRAAILTGQYAHNSGVYTNGLPNGGFQKVYADGLENSMMATWLKKAGYRTALIGKYLNGYPNGAPTQEYIPPGWTYWVSPNGGDPYSQYNYLLNNNGKTISYGSAPSAYLNDVLSSKTARFIKNSVTYFPKRPFFIFVASYLPHLPAPPPPRYADDFPGLKAPRKASFNEADVSDKPSWVRHKPRLTTTQVTETDKQYRQQRRSIQALEDLVEKVVNTLQETGQLDNTYIFFSSDNGLHLGEHRLLTGKATAYEEDIKVPLVVRGPGVPVGQVVDQIAMNADFAPTFAEIAGITPPSSIDGRSLVPFLTGTTPPVWRQVMLLERIGPSLASTDGLMEPVDASAVPLVYTGDAPSFAGLRTAEGLAYIEYDTGERELYNLAVDPDQLSNSYSISDPELITNLSTWLSLLRNTAGQALRDAEQSPP